MLDDCIKWCVCVLVCYIYFYEDFDREIYEMWYCFLVYFVYRVIFSFCFVGVLIDDGVIFFGIVGC